MSIASMCNVHRVTHYGYTVTRGSAGGQIRVPAVVKSNVACRIQQLSSRERSDLLKNGMNISHRVYFAEDPGLTQSDYLVPNTNTSRQLHVVGVLNFDELDRLWAVDCEERLDVDNTSP